MKERISRLLLIISLSAPVLDAQAASPDRLEFEVASVRPAAPLTKEDPQVTLGGPDTSDPGRIRYRSVALSNLILDAYGLERYQLSIPSSFKLKRYDIVANIPAGTSKQEFKTMLRNLLADRFHLQVHRQPTEFDTYRLVVGKRGPALKATSFKSEGLSRKAGTTRERRTDPDGITYTAGLIGVARVNGRFILSGGQVQIADLIFFLQTAFEGPVTDATGLTGEYDVRLEFSPEGLKGALGSPPRRVETNSNAIDSASDPAPNIFQAIDQQLGLRLEKTKALLDVLVVDHLEEPSDN